MSPLQEDFPKGNLHPAPPPTQIRCCCMSGSQACSLQGWWSGSQSRKLQLPLVPRGSEGALPPSAHQWPGGASQSFATGGQNKSTWHMPLATLEAPQPRNPGSSSERTVMPMSCCTSHGGRALTLNCLLDHSPANTAMVELQIVQEAGVEEVHSMTIVTGTEQIQI